MEDGRLEEIPIQVKEEQISDQSELLQNDSLNDTTKDMSSSSRYFNLTSQMSTNYGSFSSNNVHYSRRRTNRELSRVKKSSKLSLGIGLCFIAVAIVTLTSGVRLVSNKLFPVSVKANVENLRVNNVSFPTKLFDDVTNQPKPVVDANRLGLMDVFTHGPLLHAVQMNRIYLDSKHFVDMVIKRNSSVVTILMEFSRLQLSMTQFQWKDNSTLLKNPTWTPERAKRYDHAAKLLAFIDEHFDPPGSDLIPFTPVDYNDTIIPMRIAGIIDPVYRKWGIQLHKLWSHLGRLPDPSVESTFLHGKPLPPTTLWNTTECDECEFELANLPPRTQHVLFVPGGRFRESYYWDSYWIVEGLLVSGMYTSARGVVMNLLEYCNEFGFVPNGGRLYYLTRSQPPFLSSMIRLIATYDQEKHIVTDDKMDVDFLQIAVPILRREYEFWMQSGPGGHAVTLHAKNYINDKNSTKVYTLNRYISHAREPRPESYVEDYTAATAIYNASFCAAMHNCDTSTFHNMESYYNEVIAGTETGWDFTSRWLRDVHDEKSIQTSYVIPADLNSVMYQMERNMMDFYSALGEEEEAAKFEKAAADRMEAIEAILWNSTTNTWKDFDLLTHEHSIVTSVSDYSPLWANAYNFSNTPERKTKIVQALKDSGLINIGGVQTTTLHTGEQWDAPNAWAPQQEIVIEGLLTLETDEAYDLASTLAKDWVRSGFAGWEQTGLMFEKYNASSLGLVGNGGEYFPQFGFGWTNGVILKLLTVHQDLLLHESSE